MAVFSVPSDFAVIVLERMTASGAPATDRRDALALLAVILANLDRQSFACRRTTRELAALLAMDGAGITRAMKLLASVQAVALVRHYHRRAVAIVPPGARMPGRPRLYAGAVATGGTSSNAMSSITAERSAF